VVLVNLDFVEEEDSVVVVTLLVLIDEVGAVVEDIVVLDGSVVASV
jgi:hypothetical protein